MDITTKDKSLSLNISSFENMIQQGGFVARKFYRIKRVCVFVEVISVRSTNSFLISIPSKYIFPMKGEGKNNVFLIRPICTSETKNNVMDHVKELRMAQTLVKSPRDIDVEKEYGKINLPELNTSEESGIAELVEGYNNPIKISDIRESDAPIVKNIIHQLERLKYLVKNIPFTMAIFHAQYLGILTKNKIECYIVENHYRLSGRRLMVSVGFEIFLNRMNVIDNHVGNVRDEIENMLNNTFERNTEKLSTLLRKKTHTLTSTMNLHKKQLHYSREIESYKDMLHRLTEEEEKLDPQQHSEKLDEISDIKDKIVKNILPLKDHRDNLMLAVDMVLFNNAVMMNTMIDNFDEIDELCQRKLDS